MLLEISGGQLIIASVRIKLLGQSKNNGQLWMCLVVEVKFNAIMLVPIHRKLNGECQVQDGVGRMGVVL